MNDSVECDYWSHLMKNKDIDKTVMKIKKKEMVIELDRA